MENKNILFKDIISLQNINQAWLEFVVGKKYKADVLDFSLNLSFNIYQLHTELKNKTYVHGTYKQFSINDPKPRIIHKARVRDRLLHHVIHRQLYPFFDQKFIYNSYSCRIGKGTHKAIERFQKYFWRVSRNNTRTCWVLKCDIKKFFASVDHNILLEILTKYKLGVDTLWLLEKIIESFDSGTQGRGLPLGNLTSQLLVNIYMNEFDKFVKDKLNQHYIRYADDFIFLSDSREELENLILRIKEFLENKLKLQLHPDKVYIKTFASGVDFLGWVNFSDCRILRTSTKRRMIRNLKIKMDNIQTLQSYRGLLSHGNTEKLKKEILT